MTFETCSDYESEEDWSADEDSGCESDSWNFQKIKINKIYTNTVLVIPTDLKA